MTPLIARLLALCRRRQLDDELSDEMSAHLEIPTTYYVDRGVSLADARRAAGLRFGATLQSAEAYRCAANGFAARTIPSMRSSLAPGASSALTEELAFRRRVSVVIVDRTEDGVPTVCEEWGTIAPADAATGAGGGVTAQTTASLLSAMLSRTPDALAEEVASRMKVVFVAAAGRTEPGVSTACGEGGTIVPIETTSHSNLSWRDSLRCQSVKSAACRPRNPMGSLTASMIASTSRPSWSPSLASSCTQLDVSDAFDQSTTMQRAASSCCWMYVLKCLPCATNAGIAGPLATGYTRPPDPRRAGSAAWLLPPVDVLLKA
jgi:hypothetical protein